MGTRIVIIGAGGQGLVVAGILLASSAQDRLEPIGLLDDDPRLEGTQVLGIPVLGVSARLTDIAHDAIVIAIGDNRRREQLSRELEERGERLLTVRHPHASVAADVEIGAGCMISAGAVVTPGVRIGRGVLLNTSCTVDHQSVIGDYAHVSPGATVGANVTIGARTLIGLGANIISARHVGADSLIGAGALVAHDIPDGVVAFGVPARVRRPNV